MTTFEVGQTVTIAIKVYDSTGALADVGTLMVCAAVLPDGSSVAASVSNPSTGNYQAAVTATLPGRYRFTFTGTGTNSGGTPWTDVADVWPSVTRLIISVADAKAALNTTSDVNDDELRLYIAATTAVIEDIIGPVLSATGRTWTAHGGRFTVLLPEKPLSITSITENGTTVPATGYVADLASGIIYRGTYAATFPWYPGVRNVVITYAVGASVIPPNVILAAREELRFLYQQGQQGAGRPSFGDSAGYEQVFTPSGYSVPHRVRELCQASDQTVAWFA
ncbi:gp6 domain containing protein [uncultured Caudovirales phage]|uniref:Gp6 domain containing protein n=1 Tax=uncultured Caudovirales phage TaxID=2100421 RepID=A0A6J5QVA5_9CAUD|nr:gp6 domain containing protein [uncultured Caudovirales phage]CAB4185371.1 gp6 domain containing protein [uncultured Caudovirales phage]CAB4188470.1 gp6 domain containing protein [uncultured Caudovirales phage]CAB4191250.1 gp6 domain containing protein [uncultured Caudovirales phage]CAB5230132.1 gp6 domain containing protein [uncultured Caudovirales phage]